VKPGRERRTLFTAIAALAAAAASFLKKKIQRNTRAEGNALKPLPVGYENTIIDFNTCLLYRFIDRTLSYNYGQPYLHYLHMTDINWNIFKIKFNEREDKAFERLAYLLFCVEHGINTGIFRFKNQTGIETEPIIHEGETIGFQAKYYDTKLSENKGDIIDAVEKAKSKNPALNKILLYTNQELSESTKKAVKKPQYQADIEKKAKEIGVILEWRVPSHIEQQLSLPANHHLSAFFFGQGKNILDFLNELKTHAENILIPIQSTIPFAGADIKIDRIKMIADIENTSSAVTIIGVSCPKIGLQVKCKKNGRTRKEK
jgi:hypothetical protein